jgi:molybdate transport repressor ModE-like protein
MLPDQSADRMSSDAWSSPVEVRQLRALLAVVEHGSVTAAALALGLAQSTVSEALSSLDRATGTPVLLRKRGAQATMLTDAGEALLPHARRVLQEIDAMHRAVARVTRGAHANVHVIANESISTYLLAPALSALRKRWPKVRFSVTVGTCAHVRAAIATGQCDIGFLLEASAAMEGLEAAGRRRGGGATVVVPDVPLVIFGRLVQPLVRRAAPVRRDALAAYPLFVAESTGDFHDLVRGYFTADGLPCPQLQAAGSVEGVKRGVEADASALGLLPEYAVAEDIRARRVQALALSPPPPRVQLVALLPASPAETHPAIPDLVDELCRPRGG